MSETARSLRLESIRERFRSALPGPWLQAGTFDDNGYLCHILTAGSEEQRTRLVFIEPSVPNLDFVLSAWEDTRRLLECIDSLRDGEPCTVTDEELEVIGRRCALASRALWRSFVEGRNMDNGSSFIQTSAPPPDDGDIEICYLPSATQDFIAHARSDIPWMLTEVRRLAARSGKQAD